MSRPASSVHLVYNANYTFLRNWRCFLLLFVLHLFEGSDGISEIKDTMKALKKMALLEAKHGDSLKCG